MNIISINFYLFLLAAILLYYIFPMEHRWYVLLASSLLFYLSAGWEKALFVLCASLIAYVTGRMIDKIYVERKRSLTEQKRRAKRCLLPAVAMILCMLLYTKVGRNIADLYNSVFQAGGGSAVDIIVPLGISYYTFGVIGYLADVYWKKEKAEKNYLKLLLYMVYFPQIVEGPIPRHGKLALQLVEGHAFEYKRFCFGLQRMLWGYFKKLVIADRWAIVVREIYGNYISYEGLYFVVAILASAIQLYADFSGCMDIMLGISEALGISLDENFRRPFFSASAAEFWRRWHISLGTWFKDYVYMPMAISPRLIRISQWTKKHVGSRAAKSLMTVVPLAIVWLLTGLWHGTGLDYILWGCYWGLIIIISTVFAPEIKRLNQRLRINTESPYWHIWQMVRTFLIFCGGRLLTAPGDIRITGEVIRRMFSRWNPWIFFDDSLFGLGLDRKNFQLGVAVVILLWGVSLYEEKKGSVRESLASRPIVVRWIAYYGLVLSVIIFGVYGPGYDASAFVYMHY